MQFVKICDDGLKFMKISKFAGFEHYSLMKIFESLCRLNKF